MLRSTAVRRASAVAVVTTLAWMVSPFAVAPATGETSTTVAAATTVPSAVTTVPEGCPSRPVAQAVFVGVARRIARAEVAFEVTQLRAGSVDGFQSGGLVSVVYGSDAQFLKVGAPYLVGVMADGATGRLTSTVRDDTALFGGAEIAGQDAAELCPRFESPGRTLHVDGTALDSGVFTELFSRPVNILLALALPPVVALGALLTAVWWKRSRRGQVPSAR